MTPVVTLLTDFGTTDGYVGEMKGVLSASCPSAQLIDISHDVAPQDVEAARLALARYWRRFPEGAVHLVVIDPGVGTNRPAIAVESGGRFLVGPDNGVLSPALLVPGAHVVVLPTPPDASATFHGRDVFAPAAAALAGGEALGSLGASHASPIIRRTREPERWGDGTLRGEVIVIDRFGNAVTNCLGLNGGIVEIAGLHLPVRHTYGDVDPGTVLALVGSSGLIEIAERDGNAARRLGLTRGTAVLVRR